MNSEETSPTMIVAQKSVTENKQATSIRRVTIQSITPVIQKVEQHIAYLIEQTTQLRNQNANLIAAQANQKVLQNQIIQINSALQNLSVKLESLNREKDKKLAAHAVQFQKLDEEIKVIKTQNVLQTMRVDEINKNNEAYLNLIELSKQQQKEAVDQLKSSIENYYEQELIRISRAVESVQDLKAKVTFLQEKRYYDQQEVKKLAKIVDLYQFEREEMKNLILRTSFLQNNVVMMQEYQKDKKMTHIHMELIKSDIKKMLDEALTPQIRIFLPVLIKKLDELKAFQSKLDKLRTNFETSKTESKQKSNQIHQQLTQKLSQLRSIAFSTFQQMNTSLKNEITKAEKQIDQIRYHFNEKFTNIKQQVNFNKKIAEINIQEQASKLQSDLKKFIVVWGDTFIEQKKDVFYSIVQQMKPQQKLEQEKKVFNIVYQIQPLINNVKQKLQTFTKQAQQQKKHFYETLGLINNHIIKLKSDLIIETSQHRKSFDLFNSKLKSNDYLQRQISLMLSKLTETTLILYAQSIDKNFLDLQQEVYVTYNDGILIEIQDSVLKYRRKEYHPEILKRAVINQMVKMIDNAIVSQPLMKWNQDQMKPSHFNSQINHSYHTIFEENQERIKKYQTIFSQQNRGFSGEKKSFNYKNSNLGNRNKFLSIKDSLSKTIDLQSKQSKKMASTARYDKEENPVLTANQHNNFKNIRLKKLDKKE